MYRLHNDIPYYVDENGVIREVEISALGVKVGKKSNREKFSNECLYTLFEIYNMFGIKVVLNEKGERVSNKILSSFPSVASQDGKGTTEDSDNVETENEEGTTEDSDNVETETQTLI